MMEKTRSARRRPDDAPCQNCGDPTPGQYCPSCGQRKVEVRVSLGTVFGDVLQDEFVLNAALPRTVVALLFRPGLLTAEYIRGRIARYIPPLRLYLVASVVFFLIISLIGLRALDRATFGATTTRMTVDSARAALTNRLAQLEQADTASMPASARAIVRHSIFVTDSTLQTLAGSASTDTVTLDRSLEGVSAGGALPPGTLQQWARDLSYRSSIPWIERGLDRKIQQIGHLPPRDALRAVAADMLTYAPHMVFVLLPVFALLLKLLYIRRDRYYMEHFVFALHAHAFFFVMFLIMLLLPSPAGIIVLWMMLYVWLAMKRVYGQGWFRTTVKWWVLGWSYMFVFTFGLLGLTFAALLFT